MLILLGAIDFDRSDRVYNFVLFIRLRPKGH